MSCEKEDPIFKRLELHPASQKIKDFSRMSGQPAMNLEEMDQYLVPELQAKQIAANEAAAAEAARKAEAAAKAAANAEEAREKEEALKLARNQADIAKGYAERNENSSNNNNGFSTNNSSNNNNMRGGRSCRNRKNRNRTLRNRNRTLRNRNRR